MSEDSVGHLAHLFIPAVRPELALKAASSSATAIIVDLEDSVPLQEKDAARSGLAKMIAPLRAQGKSAYVRPNNDERLLRADIDAALRAGASGIVLPKAETASQIRQVDGWISEWEAGTANSDHAIDLELQIESARGLLAAAELASASERTSAMMLGVEDFSTEFGIDPNDPRTDLIWAHGSLLLAARAAGILPYGLIGAFSNYKDTEAYRQAVRQSRAFGYVGAYCIHPAQVDIAVDGFAPTAQEIEHARRVLEVFEAAEALGQAATSLDGAMIDLPVALRARATLRRAAITSTDIPKDVV